MGARKSSTSLKTFSIIKQKAIEDYGRNMAPFGGRVSAPAEKLLHPTKRAKPWQFDILVVGSGYGASITAARLAPRLTKGCRLGVLERGREWVPGTFPDNLDDVLRDSRLELTGRDRGKVKNPAGLYNVQKFDELTVMSGCGLGGSSLINANVALRPDPEVFSRPPWPEKLRSCEYLEPYFELAEYELGISKEPWDHTSKMFVQRQAAARLAAAGAHFEPANLAITRGRPGLPIINRQGLKQRACIDCGDCMTGCNVGAKNTLMQNYVPLARSAGAEFYTQVEVHRIEKINDFYQVHFSTFRPNGCGAYEKCFGSTTTRVLVLGAGSIGSSEILLRSQAINLQFSERLGCNWTANGDALGFVRKIPIQTGVAGFGANSHDNRAPVGPTIQSNLTYPARNFNGRVLIQDGAVAKAYAGVLGLLLRDMNLSRVQILLGMGHDGASGRVCLDESGNGRVAWPGLMESKYRKLIRGEFNRVAEAAGGEYQYLKAFGNQMISVHPLGGCAMADDPCDGVINHRGQVYDSAYGGDIDPHTKELRVHPGLYVADGSILPSSIACNPLLTISALAERNADLMLAEPCLSDLFAA